MLRSPLYCQLADLPNTDPVVTVHHHQKCGLVLSLTALGPVNVWAFRLTSYLSLLILIACSLSYVPYVFSTIRLASDTSTRTWLNSRWNRQTIWACFWKTETCISSW